MNPVDRILSGELRRQLDRLALPAGVATPGVVVSRHVARQRGSSLHYRQSRPYAAGDDPRLLDWHLVARTGRAFVREYEQETDRQTVVVIDASGSMNYGPPGANKLEWAVRFAAAIIYLLASHQEDVRWLIVGGGGGRKSQGAQARRWRRSETSPLGWASSESRHASNPVLQRPIATGSGGALLSLAHAADGLKGEGSTDAFIPRLALPGRVGQVVLVSDLLWPTVALETFLSLAAGRTGAGRGVGGYTSLVRVNHADERTFPFSSWAELDGMEGEGTAVVDGPSARGTYLRNLQRHETSIAAAARLRRAAFQRNTTDQPTILAVREWLTVPLGDDGGRR